MKLPIDPLCQRDSRWGEKNLGTSAVKIKTSGCVLTCLSMLCTYYKHPVTPDQLNDLLVNVNGFANQNLMKWEALSLLFPDIKWDRRIDCPDLPAPLDVIDDYLNHGKPVIVCVDFDPKEGLQQHFVLVIGKDEQGSYLIDDPWDGSTYFFQAKYGDPAKGIYGLRLYSGPVVVQEDNYQVVYKGQTLASYERNPIDTIDTITKELSGAKETIAQEVQNNASLQAALTQQEKDNADIMARLRGVESERDNAKYMRKEIEGWAMDILGIDECTAEGFRAVSRRSQDLTREIEDIAIENTKLLERVEQLKNASKYTVVWKAGKYFLGRRNDQKR